MWVQHRLTSRDEAVIPLIKVAPESPSQPYELRSTSFPPKF